MDKGMNLSGQLADWTMDDLIQIIQVTKKTGSLELIGSHRGRVHFRDGQLTGAELHGPQGVYAGTDVAVVSDIIFVLGSMESGTFALGPDDGPDGEGNDPDEITAGVEELRKLESELEDSAILETGSVSVASVIEQPVTIEPAEWLAISSLISTFSVDSLESRFGRGGAIRTLHTLHRLSLVESADVGGTEPLLDEDESLWLDQVAGDISGSDSAVVLDEERDAEVEIRIETPPNVDRPRERLGLQGVAADASTILTSGFSDEMRRLRSKTS